MNQGLHKDFGVAVRYDDGSTFYLTIDELARLAVISNLAEFMEALGCEMKHRNLYNRKKWHKL